LICSVIRGEERLKWKSLPGELRNKTHCVKNDERITLATNHDHLVFALYSL
jgi:hypothetical protein